MRTESHQVYISNINCYQYNAKMVCNIIDKYNIEKIKNNKMV